MDIKASYIIFLIKLSKYFQSFFSNDTTTTKTSLENVTSRNFYYFAIIPLRSTFTMWAKYPGTVYRNGVQVGKENEKFTVVCSCSPKTLNLIISRCSCFADDNKEMYKNMKRTCRAIVFVN